MAGPRSVDISKKSAMDSTVERAHRACEKCTRTKKKCDKLLPACSRCSRLATACCYEFVYTAPSTSVVEPAALVGYLMGGSTSSDYTGKYSIFEPGLDVSSEMIMALLSSRKIDWTECVATFRERMRPMLGIVHDEAFQKKIQGLGPKDSPQIPAVALLIVCMQLVLEYSNSEEYITLSGTQILKLPAYTVAKRLYYLLKESSGPSVELAQCALLICSFEYAHGLPRRAYATLSDVATMIALLDVRVGKYQPSGMPHSVSIEEEETRILHWSAYVADKVLHIDSEVAFLPLLIPSVADDDLLPTESHGTRPNSSPPPISSEQHPLNVSPSTMLGPFQRLCQCAALYERAIQWERENTNVHEIISVDSFSGLEAATRAMIEAVVWQSHRWGEGHGAFAVCTCLLVRLYSRVLRPLGPNIDNQTTNVEVLKAIAGINSTVRLITDTTADMNEQFARRPELLAICSPITAHAAFQCLEVLNNFQHVIPQAETRFHDVWNTLHFLSKRWGVATQLVVRVEALLEEGGSSKSQQPLPSSAAASVDIFSIGPFR